MLLLLLLLLPYSSRCTGTWESFADAASITEWLFEGTLLSDFSDATEEVAFPKDSVYQSSSTHLVLRKTQCHTNTSQEASYRGLRPPEPIASPLNQPYWGRQPEEEGSQEQAARGEAVQGAQFLLEVCYSRPSPFVVPVFCLFFSKPALLGATQ